MIAKIKLCEAPTVYCDQCLKTKSEPTLFMQYGIRQHTLYEEGTHQICKECIDDALIGPEYILMGGRVALRRTSPFNYYRDNGDWSIAIEMQNGEFRTESGKGLLSGLSIEKISIEEWAAQNRVNEW